MSGWSILAIVFVLFNRGSLLAVVLAFCFRRLCVFFSSLELQGFRVHPSVDMLNIGPPWEALEGSCDSATRFIYWCI